MQKYNTFFSYYGYVCDLCSILTFRSNISFEKVYLFQEFEKNRREICAECFIKKPDILSQRDMMNCIPIRCLDETVFENIVLNILKVDKRHKGLPVFVIPKDDLDAGTMDIGKIRNICSALEMELGLGEIYIGSNCNVNELIKQVKQLVKKHRDELNSLSSKTYDNIFGSISHWNQPLAERAVVAFKQHENEMNSLLSIYNIQVSEDDIQQFVKARNDITHNGFTGLDDDVCNTAFIIIGLIYCCTLSRIGMKQDEIMSIMARKLIG
jgi:hypothetical protein